MAQNTEATPISAFADAPIQSSVRDRLNRAGFARNLAKTLSGWGGEHSLVVALTAPWGHGKTSIKNMVVEAIRDQPSDRQPMVVQFNPWRWAGTDQMAPKFYSEIHKAIGAAELSKTSRGAADAWRRWADRLQNTAEAGDWISKNTSQIVAAFALLSGFTVAQLEKLANALVSIVAVTVLLVFVPSLLRGLSAFLASRAAKLLRAVPTIEEERDHLRGLMQSLPKPIIVIIDDIDRLSDGEVQFVFQSVKANCDFPNLIFLLLYSRKRVEVALSPIAGNAGAEYLEKIVQVSIAVPRVERFRIEQIALDEIEKILRKIPNLSFDSRRWQNLFIGALRKYFKSLRDVYRLIGAIELSVYMFAQGRNFELNAIDFIALEVLKQFEPNVYDRLSANRDFLVGDANGTRNEERQKVAEALIKTDEVRQDQVSEIVEDLFPTISSALGGVSYGSDFYGQWNKELRVCSRQYFERYFSMSIPTFDLSTSEFESFFGGLGDYDLSMDRLRAYSAQKVVGVLFSRLDDRKKDIPIEYAPQVLRLLFNIGDDLETGFLAPFMNAWRITYWYLRKERHVATREDLFKEALSKATGLSVASAILRQEDEARSEAKSDGELLFSDSGLQDLRVLWLARLREVAADRASDLITNPKLGRLLHFWSLWGAEEEVRSWISMATVSERGLISLISALASEVSEQGIDEAVSHRKFEYRLSDVAKFGDVDVWYSRLREIDLSSYDEREQKCVAAFLRAIDVRDGRRSDYEMDG
ncbi:P-loop NTPase fold protein [Ferrovibrio sp.]|uniref:KAP family P-loop NTPase fold protein n=1 Tax=Ferrovibrio sp. TaxID=1917215 RepID=UPI00351417B5